METDLIWHDQGLLTAFIPTSKAGEKAWAAMAEDNGKVLFVHRQSVISQLKKAGYTVRKGNPPKLDSIEDDNLLAQLGI